LCAARGRNCTRTTKGPATRRRETARAYIVSMAATKYNRYGCAGAPSAGSQGLAAHAPVRRSPSLRRGDEPRPPPRESPGLMSGSTSDYVLNPKHLRGPVKEFGPSCGRAVVSPCPGGGYAMRNHGKSPGSLRDARENRCENRRPARFCGVNRAIRRASTRNPGTVSTTGTSRCPRGG
jgi:hypothetical protein